MTKSHSINLLLKAIILILSLVETFGMKATLIERPDKVSSHLTIDKYKISQYGDSSYTVFEIECTEPVTTFLTAWLLIPCKKDGKREPYSVYINSHKIDEITCDCDGWQSAVPLRDRPILLKKGLNTVAFGAPSPIVPCVERISLSHTRSRTSFESTAYQNYLRKASQGQSPAAECSNLACRRTIPGSFNTHPDIPLLYTFYTILSFNCNERVTIISTSETEHALDMQFYGRDPSDSIDDGMITSLPSMTRADTLIERDPFQDKITKYRLPPLDDQAQGINWKGPSEYSPLQGCQVSRLRMRIPRSGQYLVRLRAAHNYDIGIASLDVNGQYFYNDCPLWGMLLEDSIPDDGNYYSTYALSSAYSEADPMLWVHGALADRSVGFNDDIDISQGQPFPVTGLWDPWVVQSYKVCASGVSVSNWSSYTPVSACDVSVGELHHYGTIIGGGDQPSDLAPRIEEEQQYGDSLNCKVEAASSSTVKIWASAVILTISSYSITGHCLGTIIVSDNETRLSESALGLPGPGMYILRIHTHEGCCVRKVLIK